MVLGGESSLYLLKIASFWLRCSFMSFLEKAGWTEYWLGFTGRGSLRSCIRGTFLPQPAGFQKERVFSISFFPRLALWLLFPCSSSDVPWAGWDSEFPHQIQHSPKAPSGLAWNSQKDLGVEEQVYPPTQPSTALINSYIHKWSG